MRDLRRTEPKHPEFEGRLERCVTLPPRRNGGMAGERQRGEAVDDTPRLEFRGFPPVGSQQPVGDERVERAAKLLPRRRGR